MKKIIFGTIVMFLLMFTSASAWEILGTVEDNTILNLRTDSLAQNLDVTFNNYVINEETINFYFSLNDYDRAEDEEGVIKNYRVRREFEAILEINPLVSCLESNDANYCNSNLINNEEVFVVDGIKVYPVRKQLLMEIEGIGDKIEEYKTEIRRNKNPIINFLESLNLGNILG